MKNIHVERLKMVSDLNIGGRKSPIDTLKFLEQDDDYYINVSMLYKCNIICLILLSNFFYQLILDDPTGTAFST